MDPLGAVSDITKPEEIVRWGQAPVVNDPLLAASVLGSEPPCAHQEPPFKVRPDLNEKVAFWVGDISKLGLESVVNPTNESLTDKNPISNKLLEVAGQELREDLRNQVVSCRTGDAKITTAYALPARHVIHTVGPRYNTKYRTAAESALYNCYRSVLQLTKSRHITTVAIPTLVSCRRSYPPVEGAHIALRTVRRFLEHFTDEIDLIVFVAEDDDPIYQLMFSIFFPRTPEEEDFSMKYLPLELGNEFGEPVIVERQIRIMDQPFSKRTMSNAGNGTSVSSGDNSKDNSGDDDDDDEGTDGLSGVGQHPFAMMTTNKDSERKEAIVKQKASMTEEQERLERYQNFLRMARTEVFTDLTGTGAFYRAGKDYQNRQVVVYAGKLFPATKFDLNKAVSYFVSIMEPIVRREYVLVYFHTESDPDNQPDSIFFKELYALLDSRYKNHLKYLFIVHSNWWFKMSSWWFLTWTAPEIKDNVVHLTGVEYLYDFINPQQISVPPFVMEYDKKVNGTGYYKPVPAVQKVEEPLAEEL